MTHLSARQRRVSRHFIWQRRRRRQTFLRRNSVYRRPVFRRSMRYSLLFFPLFCFSLCLQVMAGPHTQRHWGRQAKLVKTQGRFASQPSKSMSEEPCVRAMLQKSPYLAGFKPFQEDHHHFRVSWRTWRHLSSCAHQIHSNSGKRAVDSLDAFSRKFSPKEYSSKKYTPITNSRSK